jgi:TRAP-type C4-dicarboxylate transport system permease small subunit
LNAGLIAQTERALGLAERLFHFLANLCLGLMFVFNMANIAWRGLTDVSLKFVWPWTLLLFIWMSFFGFYVIYRRAKDISVDYFVELGGPKALFATRLISDLLCAALMALMLIEAPRTLVNQVGDMELIPLQRYWMSVPLFLTSALLLIHFLLDIAKAVSGEPEPRKDYSAQEE